MSSTPHPALRRLLSAAAAPGRCLEALDAAAPELAALGRGLEDAALVVDRALEPLARGIDLAAVLGRAAAPRQAAEARSTAPVRGGSAPAPGAPVVDRPARRVREAALPLQGARAASPALAHDPNAVAEVLSRFSGAAEAGRSRITSVEPEDAAGLPRPAGTDSDAEPVVRRGASPVSAEAAEVRRLVSREEAAAVLRRRTPAVAGDAMDTPVRVEEPIAEVAALLAMPAEGGLTGTPTTVRATVESFPPDQENGRLADALERVRARRMGRTATAGGDVPAVGDAMRQDPADRDVPDPRRAPREAAVAAVGGLRGLVRRVEAAGQQLPAAPAGTFPSGGAEPPAGVVAARADEAELAERIDRLLRREARRQGIDLEGVGP